MNQIFNCDCVEGMKKLPDNSVDMILSDLPYNMTNCDYDKNKIDLKEYWTQARRILKPKCSAVMFASSKFSVKLINSNLENYRYKWAWLKNAPTFFVHAKNAPMRIFEEILIFSDGKIGHSSTCKNRMKYFPQGLRQGGRFYKGDKSGAIYSNSNGSLAHTYQAEFSNYPADVLYFDAVFNGGRLHPSQKPIDLCEYLIKTYTVEGETVLDTCMGAGTTAIAALNTGRNFIGFELDEKYFKISQQRIAEARNEDYRDSDSRLETV